MDKKSLLEYYATISRNIDVLEEQLRHIRQDYLRVGAELNALVHGAAIGVVIENRKGQYKITRVSSNFSQGHLPYVYGVRKNKDGEWGKREHRVSSWDGEWKAVV